MDDGAPQIVINSNGMPGYSRTRANQLVFVVVDVSDETEDEEMAPSPDDELRFFLNASRWIEADVASRLWTRGWAVTDLFVSDGETLEWFWPPTAPVGYGGLPDWSDDIMRLRPGMFGPRQTPWMWPTRVTRTESVWTLEYGEATAKKPDTPREYTNDEALLADLERIECWPMTISETREIQAARLLESTTANATDAHYRAVFRTEPYASRGNAIRAHQLFEDRNDRDARNAERPSVPRMPGNLTAQQMLVDAQAWASAVRTARAGGSGWGINGPEQA
ncbi:hypothetical protein [Arthrobacter sp.]|uniref:hypothetical protein n=1 Tax=Arthrobacter sp. TaxID=1667 RepID=UPI003A8C8BCC